MKTVELEDIYTKSKRIQSLVNVLEVALTVPGQLTCLDDYCDILMGQMEELVGDISDLMHGVQNDEDN